MRTTVGMRDENLIEKKRYLEKVKETTFQGDEQNRTQIAEQAD